MARSEPRVVVVGAGIGGLVSALLLAHQGVAVTLVESASGPGGKMHRLRVDGADVDAGPTVLTMRWVFEEILAAVGATLADLPALTRLDVLARHAWRGHAQTLDLYADAARSVEAVGDFAGAAEARRFEAFCREVRTVYRTLETPYLRSARPDFFGMVRSLGPSGLGTLSGLGPFATLWQTLGRHFRDPRLRQLFARYATYCGASPWQAPATLELVAQVEMDGVWTVDGGMHALARRMADLAAARGAVLRWHSPVQRILLDGGRACGVQLASGETLAADAVLFNGDPQALVQGLLGDAVRRAVPAVPAAQRSLSAVTWAVHAPTSGFELAHHNVFFDDDYASEFDDIFRHRRLPRQGTVYVCAQDRGQGAGPDRGAAERLLCLVNAPADGDHRSFDDVEVDPCEFRSLGLMRACGLRIGATHRQVRRTTPQDFARRFPATGGALYGQATHGWMTLFRRPGAASAVPGLFLAGGGVHPGPGVPMAALSGQRAASALMAHLASTRRWHPVATSGGTSTPSATTVATP
ncbi:1-hydroxycarotenoid 3,4-desaturase CrtD [Rubrivivax albus]|uniref:1-hydroxycarotenoid 3,4-desaturase CrtD n=1 Tax=Rubrivivax albus TaxID=2499835 RepID=UPI001E561174|nr:1-hydroxycarotenoid 3,4-desaturase CrtD [Rubrivivax albus]